MRRVTALIFLVLVLTTAVVAQQPAPPATLIRRAHDLSANLEPVNRAWLLSFILRKSLYPPGPEMQPWAEEAFLLSLQLPLDKREFVQTPAITVMSRLDPDRALAMLNQMEIAPSNAARGSAAAQVFQAMLIKHGPSSIPALMDAAKKLGTGGGYPYLAMIGLLPRSTPEQREMIFQNVTAAYLSSTPSMQGDAEFVRFLKAMAPRIAPDSAKRAAPGIAGRLQRLAESDPTCPFDLRFRSDTGTTVLDCGDSVAWEALSTLRKMDATSAERLIASRPPLQQPRIIEEQQGANPMRMAKHAPTIQADRAQENFDTQGVIREVAKEDAGKAVQLASSVPDGNYKINGMILTAMEVAEKDPARARQLVNEVQSKVGSVEDIRWKMTILNNVATTAERLKDKPLAEQTIRSVFALGPRYIEESKPVELDRRLVRAYNGYVMATATRVGTRVSPQLTLQLVEGIADEEARGYLLLEIADVLSHPQSKY